MKDINKMLKAKVNVRNMTSNSGNSIPNQFIVRTEYGRMFKSYDSNIAFIPYDENIIYLGKDWNYSVTTGKYRNEFLGINKKELEARIEAGTAKVLKDL